MDRRQIVWTVPLVGLLMFVAFQYGRQVEQEVVQVIRIEVMHIQGQQKTQPLWENAVYRPEEINYRGLWKR